MPPRVGFVIEQALGHATHAENLSRLLRPEERIQAEFALVPYAPDPRWQRVPGYQNWTVRAGLRARRAVRGLRAHGRLGAMFVHTQVPATLMPDELMRTPTVVSLDATPAQYDQLGHHYDHELASPLTERVKRQFHSLSFTLAKRLVTWSTWAKTGLVEGYGVDPEKIVVIPPGVDRERWSPGSGDRSRRPGEAVRVLFVGGDLERKGGRVLIAAVERLRAAGADVELDVVTRDEVAPQAWIRVHRGLTPNSDALRRLFHDADLFCLPTFGDTLAIVLAEAGAMGLPSIATPVGGIPEVVRDGESGLLVPPGDEDALASAIGRLVADADLRRRFGDRAHALVASNHDAAVNAARLVDVLLAVARDRQGSGNGAAGRAGGG